jgi:hypothetical protein
MEDENEIRNSNLRAEIAELHDRIADLEGQLAVAKAAQWQQNAITWYPTAGAASVAAPLTFDYTITSTNTLPPNWHISGSSWCGT